MNKKDMNKIEKEIKKEIMETYFEEKMQYSEEELYNKIVWCVSDPDRFSVSDGTYFVDLYAQDIIDWAKENGYCG